jgi:hypothetical protein
MSDSNLSAFASFILNSMTDNIYFQSPVPSIEEAREIISDYKTARSKCQTMDRHKIAVKNQKRELVVTMLNQWSDYVIMMSMGDPVKASTSGFEVIKKNSSRPPLEKPLAPVITHGLNNGELLIQGSYVKGARSYIFQYATEEEMLSDKWNSFL